GWYPDRNEANVVRWWDGQQWTDHTQSTAPAAAAFEQPVSSAAFGFTPVEPNPVAVNPVAVNLVAATPVSLTTVAATPVAQNPAAAVTPAIVPGWYPDNADRSLQRWWDGTQWTTHTSPAASYYPGAGAYGAATERVSSANNTMATLAMILSLVSFGGLVLAPLLVLALAGIIVGIVAIRRSPRFAPEGRRRGQAIAGIVVGAVSLVVTILLTVAAVAVYLQVHRPDNSASNSQQSSPQTGGGTATDSTGGISFPTTIADLKQAVAKSVQRQDLVAVTSVTCDAAASMVAGSTFECGVGVSDGRWTPVRVDIQKSTGSGMAYGLGFGPLLPSDATATSPDYTLEQIEQQLSSNLPQAWEFSLSDLRCDSTASTTPGSSFQCMVSLDDGRVGVVQITMVAPGGYDVTVIHSPDQPSGSSGSTDPDLSNS
ncbi:MAG: DUF2510 domain-containing protein, partial [Pseudolysinimonas sp.]